MRLGGSLQNDGVAEPSSRTLTAARWRARIVTLGLLLVIVFAVTQTVEAWPVTSFRLFSSVRTANVSNYKLIAVDDAGHERPIVVDDAHAFARRTSSQLATLSKLPVTKQRAKAMAMLDAAGLAHAHVHEVILRRTSSVGRLDRSALHHVQTRDVLHIVVGP